MSKEKFKGIIIGMAIMLVFSMGTPLSWAKDLKENILVSYSNIKIVINGVQIDPRDGNGRVVEPFIYDGTTYLPVRAVAESLGLRVNWNPATQTVTLDEGGAAQEMASYNNSRFGFQVSYPGYWGSPFETDNGDGAVLFDNSKIGVRAYGSYALMVFDEDLDTYANEYYPGSTKHNTVVPGAKQALLLVCDYGGGNYEEVLLAVKDDTIYTFSISVEGYYGLENMDNSSQKIFTEAQNAMESMRIN